MRHDRHRSERLPRRGTDRVEDAAAWLLTVVSMVLLVVAVVIGVAVHGRQSERALIESTTRTQVEAVLLEDAPVVIGEQGSRLPVMVPARWTDLSGVQHTDQVTARSMEAAGSVVDVWIDQEGQIAAPPARASGAAAAGILAATGVLLAGGTILACAWFAVRCMTAAANARRWEREWARVGPEWSRHLR